VIRLPYLRAVLGRETEEILLNRLLLVSILLPPLVLVAAPLLLGGLVATEPLPPAFADQLVTQRPDWAGLDREQLTVAFTVQQFVAFFLMLPGYVPLSIATFSVVGEKQSRSLEAVLATPIRTSELLGGKAIAALVPGVLACWLAYAALVVLGGLLHGPWFVALVTDASWLAAVFLLGPAVGLLSVVLGILVSSRVNDPRTAQQVGAVVVVPVVAITLLQATGTAIVGPAGYAVLAVVVTVTALVALRLGVGLFARESILTRWR
jgi:ABC-2 type transport system permease protein